MTEYEERIKTLTADMEDWVEGRRSWTNTLPDTTAAGHAAAAVMDAQEVIKRSTAIQAYVALLNAPASQQFSFSWLCSLIGHKFSPRWSRHHVCRRCHKTLHADSRGKWFVDSLYPYGPCERKECPTSD